MVLIENKYFFTDYIYYLHEPYEDQHLFMSVYPYEVPLQYLDANNDNGIFAGSIIYRKEMIRKIPGKGGCKEISMKEFVECSRTKLKEDLENYPGIKCIVPALSFIGFNTFDLEYCKTDIEATAQNKLIYVLAQEAQRKNLCQGLCNRTIYFQRQTKMSKVFRKIIGISFKD